MRCRRDEEGWRTPDDTVVDESAAVADEAVFAVADIAVADEAVAVVVRAVVEVAVDSSVGYEAVAVADLMVRVRHFH